MNQILLELSWRGGVADASTLSRISRAGLARAVREGKVLRVAQGRYALPDVETAHLAAHALSGARSHLTAALAYHWGVAQPPPHPHIIVPRGRKVALADRRRLAIHWRNLTDDDRRLMITDPLTTVLDCARTLPFAEAVAVADSALRSGRVGLEELRRGAERLRGPGAAAACRVAEVADGRAANPFESVLRAHAMPVRSLRLIPQVEIWDADFVARVDLADERHKIVAEADSYQFHSGRAAFAADMRRYNELALRGWLVLRFSFEEVFGAPQRVTDTLRRAVSSRRGVGHDAARRPQRALSA